MSDLELEPASFRDPASTVAYLDGRVLRGLTKEGAEDFGALASAPFYQQAMTDGRLPAVLPDDAVPAAAPGPQGHPLPAVAPRPGPGHPAAGAHPAVLRHRPAARRRAQARHPPRRYGAAALRRARAGHPQGAEGRRL